MGVSENIRALRQERGLTQEQLADKVGVARSTVTQWETGWSQPRMGMINRLASVFGTSASAIVAADGDSFAHGSVPVFSTGEATVPLMTLGKVHAGEPTEEEQAEERVDVPASVLRSHPNARALIVEGDCMDRVVPEGGVALYDPDMEPGNGSIAVVELEDYRALMRRWYRGSSTLMLAADSHSEHEDIVITGDDPVRVLGVVCWWQAREELS